MADVSTFLGTEVGQEYLRSDSMSFVTMPKHSVMYIPFGRLPIPLAYSLKDDSGDASFVFIPYIKQSIFAAAPSPVFCAISDLNQACLAKHEKEANWASRAQLFVRVFGGRRGST